METSFYNHWSFLEANKKLTVMTGSLGNLIYQIHIWQAYSHITIQIEDKSIGPEVNCIKMTKEIVDLYGETYIPSLPGSEKDDDDNDDDRNTCNRTHMAMCRLAAPQAGLFLCSAIRSMVVHSSDHIHRCIFQRKFNGWKL